MRRMLAVGALLAAAMMGLAGCSLASGGTTEDAPVPGVAEPDAGGAAPFEPGSEGSAVGDAGGEAVGGDDLVLDEDRDIVVTGDMTITTEDPLRAAEQAVDIVERAGGRIDSRTETAPTDLDNGHATLTLRIPADALSAVLDELRGLGRADSVNLATDDVTNARRDLEARISALRASIQRLTELIARAEATDDLIALEREISDRQAQLESYQAQERDLSDRVSMSTIRLELRSQQEAPEPEPDDFLSGLARGWDAFVGFWSGLLVALGVLLPWLITVAMVAGVVVLLLRRRRAASAPVPDEE